MKNTVGVNKLASFLVRQEKRTQAVWCSVDKINWIAAGFGTKFYRPFPEMQVVIIETSIFSQRTWCNLMAPLGNLLIEVGL
jgi:hypothetical protein